MATFSRRDLGRLVVGVPLSLAMARQTRTPLTTVNGVVFGVETFSFHDLPPSGDPALIPTIIRNMQALGIAECEIMSGHVEPYPSAMTGWWVQSRRAPDFARLRDEARHWRLTVPMDYYRTIRQQFEDAGLRIYLYNVNFNETFTDAERDRTFEAAKVLGAEGFSSSTVLSEARRLVPFVDRHKMFVAMHNHNNLADPDQFATPASFETAHGDVGPLSRHTRYRALRRRQQRPGSLHHQASRPHRQRPRPRSETGQRTEPPVWPGRHADQRGHSGSFVTTATPYGRISSTEYGSFRSSLEETRVMFQYCKDVLG